VRENVDGVQVYSFFVDGEAAPSVNFSMRMAAGIVFDPVIVDRRTVQPLKNDTPPADAPRQKGFNLSAIPISAPVRWNAGERFGKGSDKEGYWLNIDIPVRLISHVFFDCVLPRTRRF